MGDEDNGVEGDKPALVNSRDAESSCLRSGKMSNGFANGHDSDVAEGSSGGSECVRTYKRRKQVKLESKSGENERATAGALTISVNQISREPIVGASDFHVSEQLHVLSVVHHAVENGCNEHSQNQCSSIVLEHIKFCHCTYFWLDLYGDNEGCTYIWNCMLKMHLHNTFLLRGSRSQVFKAMLENEMQESQSGIMNISVLLYNVLQAFVKYVYTAEACLDERWLGRFSCLLKGTK